MAPFDENIKIWKIIGLCPFKLIQYKSSVLAKEFTLASKLYVPWVYSMFWPENPPPKKKKYFFPLRDSKILYFSSRAIFLTFLHLFTFLNLNFHFSFLSLLFSVNFSPFFIFPYSYFPSNTFGYDGKNVVGR